MVITVALLAATLAPLPNKAQLSCSLIGTGDVAATTLDLDTRARKGPGVAIRVAGEVPYARVSATSPVGRLPDGSSAVSFSTGSGRYRLELSPLGDAVQARLASVQGDLRPTVAQGYCATRKGKRLPKAKLASEPVDLTVPPRPWKLQPLKTRLPEMRCRLIGADRQMFEANVRVTASQGNELSASYTFTGAGPLGASTTFGSGTQFFLVAPTERLVATTIQLAGVAPSFYMHTTFERLGNWVDLSRDGRILAVGACGTPLPLVASGASQ